MGGHQLTREQKVTNWTALQETLKLMRNSITSQEDNDNDNDTLIEDGSDMCQTPGTASVSGGDMSPRKKARKSGKVVSAVGSERSQDAREYSKSITVHRQQLKGLSGR